MKKIYLSLIGLSFLAACSSNKTDEKKVETSVFIEQKVADFVAKNPDWVKGEKVNEEITDKFQREVKRWSNEVNFLKGMPLELSALRDTTIAEQKLKIGTFIGYSDNGRAIGSLLNTIQLRVEGIISPALNPQPILKGKYTLNGSLYKQGSRKDVKIISVADFKGYDLGNYMFSIAEAKPITTK